MDVWEDGRGGLRQLLILKSKIVSNEYQFASTAIHKNKSMCYAYIYCKSDITFLATQNVYIYTYIIFMLSFQKSEISN